MKKRVNITVDEELHEWATNHFGEREFSKAISDHLVGISSSIEVAREIADEEVKYMGIMGCRDKLEVELELDDKQKIEDENYWLKLEKQAEVGKCVNLKTGNIMDLSEDGLKAQTLKEFEISMDLARKYENSEEGYPLHMSEKELATMARVTKKVNLMDEELRRKRIQAKVEKILEPTRHALTEALFEIELEANKIARL